LQGKDLLVRRNPVAYSAIKAARSAGRLRRGHLAGGRHGTRDRIARRLGQRRGNLDFRGTLGVSREAPVGFRDIRLRFDLDTDAPADKLDSLIKLTERYCVVYQTLRTPAKLALSVRTTP
jgi:uncharacterized OsmC-like protein